jgi:two-component system, OmpR family, phosphate regulon sensor histidine kinase PhoR
MGSSRSTARPQTLTGRLLLWHVVAVLAVLLGLGVVVDRVLEGYFVDQLTDGLVADARAVQQALPPDAPEAEVIRLGHALGARITIIGVDGVVLADSDHDPTTMENHLGRPEVRQALAGHIGISSRPSATIGIAYRYVALPPASGRIVRLAVPLTRVHSRLATIRVILGVGIGIAALAGFAALALIARGVSRPLRRASGVMDRVAGGDLTAELPEAGTREVKGLARALNRMRSEVGARIEDLERERGTRDAVLSRLDEGVVLFGPDGGVEYQNRSAARLMGEIERLQQVAPATLREAIDHARGEGRRRSVEVAGPGSRVLAATAVTVPGEGRTLLVIRDVTEARAVDAVRRDFVANASHELKTPAASVRALAETIGTASADDPGSVPRFAAQLEREAVRLSRIISDLLDLSRLEGEIGERAEVRLDRLVQDEVDRARDSGGQTEVTINFSAGSPVLVTGSSRDLALLVRNLVENAVQYTRPGGTVNVEVQPEDGRAVLTVRDDGVGIPTKDQARVFERFYRVDRARSRDTGGTGLGLSIVKHVVENHGGTVDVVSGLGEGSTFTVRLPLAKEPAANHRRPRGS